MPKYVTYYLSNIAHFIKTRKNVCLTEEAQEEIRKCCLREWMLQQKNDQVKVTRR